MGCYATLQRPVQANLVEIFIKSLHGVPIGVACKLNSKTIKKKNVIGHVWEQNYAHATFDRTLPRTVSQTNFNKIFQKLDCMF